VARALALCLFAACARDIVEAPTTHARGTETPREEGPVRTVVRVQRPRSASAPRPPRQAPEPLSVLPEELTRPTVPRLIAIGDLHGDLDASRRALRLAGAIDEADAWIGGTLTVVQTGDVLDRGDEDREIGQLLARLRGEASAAGGELITLSGNHELMNTMLTFDYVTPGGFTSFGGRAQRAEAFRPGGDLARQLAEQPIVIKVGDNVFAHGGILPEHVRYGLDRMNDEIQSFMRGELASAPSVATDGNGVLWTRFYSNFPGPAECQELAVALRELGAKRMIVGHTPQLQGISSACEERVLRIDTGVSRFYLSGPLEVLEIEGDSVRVLRENAAPAAPRAVL
jgi:hypothetical protein